MCLGELRCTALSVIYVVPYQLEVSHQPEPNEPLPSDGSNSRRETHLAAAGEVICRTLSTLAGGRFNLLSYAQAEYLFRDGSEWT